MSINEKSIDYIYTDESGAAVYKKTRTAGKKGFIQSSYDPVSDTWSDTLDNVTQYYIYNLVAVNEAKAKGLPVFFVEGEKDVETLRALGFTAATTGSSGSYNSHAEEYTSQLADCDIILMGDTDEAGRKYIQTVGNAICGVARSVRIFDLAVSVDPLYPPEQRDKKDITDVLGKQYGELPAAEKREQATEYINIIIAEANDFVPTVKPAAKDSKKPLSIISFADIEEKPVDWLWQDIFARGMLNSIQGMPGVGKTWLLCAISAAISNGAADTILPSVSDTVQKPVTGKVLFLSGDDDYSTTIKPRLRTCGANMSNVLTIEGDMLPAADSEELAEVFEKVKPTLVILDTLQHFLSGKTDMNAANATTSKLSPLKTLAERYNAAVVVIQHVSKMAAGGNGSNSVNYAIGSSAINGLFRSVWTLARLKDSEGKPIDTRALCHSKCNLVEGDPDSVLFTLTKANGFQWAGTDDSIKADELFTQPARDRGRPSDKRDDTAEQIISFLKNNPDGKCKSGELLDYCLYELNVSESTYRRARKAAGIIDKNENGIHFSMLKSYGNTISDLPNLSTEEF